MLTYTSFKTFNELYTFQKIYRVNANVTFNIFVTLETAPKKKKILEDIAFRNKS